MRRALAILACVALLAPLSAGAVNSTSTSFYIRQNIQDTSGGSNAWSFSTSTTFKLLSAGGQTAVGTSSPGTNFTVHGGFLRNLFKSVKPVYTLEHYHWRRDDGSETTATAAVAEDTATTSVAETTTQRLRVLVSNEGGTEAQYATQQLRLEYGLKSTVCSAVVSWTDVGAGAGDWDMSNTANLTNGNDTTDIATGVGGVTNENRTFISDNNAVLDTSSQTAGILIPSDSFIEIEYAIQALSAATDGGTYCFRVTDAGTATLYSYDVYPEATIAGGNALPVASAVSIDSGATSVTLIENTTKSVVCAGTVTDNDGFANITAVGGFLYRTTVGTTSASDNNNLYRLYGDSQCVPSGGSGLSETYTCTFPVEYYADATDTGSPNDADTWSCELHPRDAVATGTPAVDTVEMASLMALDVTATIPYGSVDANTDTGSTNQPTTISNTGNRDMDPELSGSSMTGAGTITSSQQKYLAAAFTYSGGGTALSGTPTQVNLDLPQRTVDTASNWFDTDYGYCREFTMTAGGNSGGVATTTTAGFALVATSTITSLKTLANGGAIEQTSTSFGTTTPVDVVFTNGTDCTTAGGDTVLDYYFEKYVPTTGEFVAWVEPTDISSTSAKTVLMYYGSPSVSDLSDEAGVFGALGEAAVWNLHEDPGSAGASGILDSTSNNKDGTDAGSMTTGDLIQGFVDGAFDFDGTDDRIEFGAVNLPGDLTLSAWVRPDSVTCASYCDILANYDAAGLEGEYELTINSSNFKLAAGTGGGFQEDVAAVTLNPSTWYHVMVRRNAANTAVQFYIDGTAVTTNRFFTGSISATPGNASIGRAGQANAQYFDGLIDDVRAFARQLHAMDVKTIYNNTRSSSIFWTIGSEETDPGGGGSISDLLYWGLGVPNGTPNGSYTGTNTFTAAAGI